MPLRLQSITLREIHLPLREPFRTAAGEKTHRRILLLEVADADGMAVWSECVAQEEPGYAPETIDTAWDALRHWLAPLLLHRSFARPEEVAPALDRQVRGHRMAKAALETAMWALAAQRRGISLARLLGGERARIEVGRALGIEREPTLLVEKVRGALAEGYLRIKLKIEPGADVAPVRAVREALGAEVPLMVDANCAYGLGDVATFRALDELGLWMIEQPLGWDDLADHAALQQMLRTPICLDESITGPGRVREMLALGSGRIVNVKPGRVGGLAPAKAIHDLCAEHGLPLWCGGMLESGIGRAYNVALASLPGFTIPGDVSPSRRYWEQDIVTPEWTMASDGTVEVPLERPGIGVEVDRDRVETLTVRTVTLS